MAAGAAGPRFVVPPRAVFAGVPPDAGRNIVFNVYVRLSAPLQQRSGRRPGFILLEGTADFVPPAPSPDRKHCYVASMQNEDDVPSLRRPRHGQRMTVSVEPRNRVISDTARVVARKAARLPSKRETRRILDSHGCR